MAQGKDRDGRSGDGGRKVGGMALPADLERSLRHLDDAQLDRLLEAVTAEAQRRGRTDGRKSGTETRGKPAAVTPGQERLILAAHEAGLKPAAIAKEFRLSRPAVQDVIKAAERNRRKTERSMVRRQGRTATRGRLVRSGCGSMTESRRLSQGDRGKLGSTRRQRRYADIGPRHGT